VEVKSPGDKEAAQGFGQKSQTGIKQTTLSRKGEEMVFGKQKMRRRKERSPTFREIPGQKNIQQGSSHGKACHVKISRKSPFKFDQAKV